MYSDDNFSSSSEEDNYQSHTKKSSAIQPKPIASPPVSKKTISKSSTLIVPKNTPKNAPKKKREFMPETWNQAMELEAKYKIENLVTVQQFKLSKPAVGDADDPIDEEVDNFVEEEEDVVVNNDTITTSESFDPYSYILTHYSKQKFDTLCKTCSQLELVQKLQVKNLKNLVKSNMIGFITGVEIVDTIFLDNREVQSKLLRNMDHLNQFTNSTLKNAQSLLNPLLQKQEWIEQIRMTLNLIEKLKFVLSIPFEMKSSITNRDYKKFITEYKRAKYFAKYKTNQITTTMNTIDELMKQVTQLLYSQLTNVNDDFEEQEKCIFYLYQMNALQNTKNDPLEYYLHHLIEKMASTSFSLQTMTSLLQHVQRLQRKSSLLFTSFFTSFITLLFEKYNHSFLMELYHKIQIMDNNQYIINQFTNHLNRIQTQQMQTMYEHVKSQIKSLYLWENFEPIHLTEYKCTRLVVHFVQQVQFQPLQPLQYEECILLFADVLYYIGISVTHLEYQLQTLMNSYFMMDNEILITSPQSKQVYQWLQEELIHHIVRIQIQVCNSFIKKKNRRGMMQLAQCMIGIHFFCEKYTGTIFTRRIMEKIVKNVIYSIQQEWVTWLTQRIPWVMACCS